MVHINSISFISKFSSTLSLNNSHDNRNSDLDLNLFDKVDKLLELRSDSSLSLDINNSNGNSSNNNNNNNNNSKININKVGSSYRRLDKGIFSIHDKLKDIGNVDENGNVYISSNSSGGDIQQQQQHEVDNNNSTSNISNKANSSLSSDDNNSYSRGGAIGDCSNNSDSNTSKSKFVHGKGKTRVQIDIEEDEDDLNSLLVDINSLVNNLENKLSTTNDMSYINLNFVRNSPRFSTVYKELSESDLISPPIPSRIPYSKTSPSLNSYNDHDDDVINVDSSNNEFCDSNSNNNNYYYNNGLVTCKKKHQQQQFYHQQLQYQLRQHQQHLQQKGGKEHVEESKFKPERPFRSAPTSASSSVVISDISPWLNGAIKYPKQGGVRPPNKLGSYFISNNNELNNPRLPSSSTTTPSSSLETSPTLQPINTIGGNNNNTTNTTNAKLYYSKTMSLIPPTLLPIPPMQSYIIQQQKWKTMFNNSAQSIEPTPPPAPTTPTSPPSLKIMPNTTVTTPTSIIIFGGKGMESSTQPSTSGNNSKYYSDMIDLDNSQKVKKLKDLIKSYSGKIINLISKISKNEEEFLQNQKSKLLKKIEKTFLREDNQIDLLKEYQDYFVSKNFTIDYELTIIKEKKENLKKRLIDCGFLTRYLDDDSIRRQLLVFSTFFLKSYEAMADSPSVRISTRKLKILQAQQKKLKMSYKNSKYLYTSETIERRSRRLRDIIGRAVSSPDFKEYFPWDENLGVQRDFDQWVMDSRFSEGKHLKELITVLSEDVVVDKKIKPVDIEDFVIRFADTMVVPHSLPQTLTLFDTDIPIQSLLIQLTKRTLYPKIHSLCKIILNKCGGIPIRYDTELQSKMDHLRTMSIKDLNLIPNNFQSNEAAYDKLCYSQDNLYNKSVSIINEIVYHMIPIDIIYIIQQTISSIYNISVDIIESCQKTSPKSNNALLRAIHSSNNPNEDRKVSSISSNTSTAPPSLKLYTTIKEDITSSTNNITTISSSVNNNNNNNNDNENYNDNNNYNDTYNLNDNNNNNDEYYDDGNNAYNNDNIYNYNNEYNDDDDNDNIDNNDNNDNNDDNNDKQEESSPTTITITPPATIEISTEVTENTTANNNNNNMTSATTMSADDLFPLFIYVLIHSNVIGASPLLTSLLEKFSSEMESGGEFGWCSVSFQAAISHLHQL